MMGGLLKELRRRNVFRVAGVYAVMGWLLAQVSALLEGSLGLPQWFDALVISLLALGFPLAVLFAWMYELTPEGLKRTADVPESESIAAKSGRRLDYALLGGLALVALLFAADRLIPEAPSSVEAAASRPSQEGGEANDDPRPEEAPARRAETVGSDAPAASIAVLPFADLSPGKDQEYFSDGISEEILNVLTRVDGLKVASRTSSFQFRGAARGVPAIASELGVRHILEGSVRKAGETIRITAQLIDAQTDAHLWSETFDRTLTIENIFAIQEEIAQAIVGALRTAMRVGPAPAILVAAPTDNLTAYELFLEARPLFQARTRLDVADQLLERAIGQDPQFAKAWEMRAALQSLMFDYQFTTVTREAADRRAIEFAGRALAIEPKSATAIAVTAKLKMNANGELRGPFDNAEIIEDYKRALAIDPRNAEALNWLGLAYSSVGYLDEALAAFAACRKFEPFHVPCTNNHIFALAALGRDDEAMDLVRESVGKDLSTSAGYFGLLARSNEELAFMLQVNRPCYLSGWRRHRELYYAYKHPGRDHRALIEDIRKHKPDESDSLQTCLGGDILVALGDHDALPSAQALWDRSLANYRRSPQFKAFIQKSGAFDFWRQHGFPPQCKPVGKTDFACE